MFRVGHGIDVHQFSADKTRPCVLGGVTIPDAPGLLGHSDADVIIHALCDALLGAAGLSDIGHLFPDTDPKYKNIPSINLLQHVMNEIRPLGLRAVNVDVTLLAEVPRIAPYTQKMKETLAIVLDIEIGAISIKASTTERLGFIGRREGVEAHAVCLLRNESGR